MRAGLFCHAAARIGLRAMIFDKPELEDIAESAYPCVVIANDHRAVVLVSRAGDNLTIYDPAGPDYKQGQTRLISHENLAAIYSGHVIYVSPSPEFLNPAPSNTQETHAHWFWSVVQENRPTYILILVGSLLINFLALAGPLFTMNVYDRVIPNNALETGWALGIGVLIVFIFDFVLRTLRAYLIDVTGRSIDVRVGRKIFDQVLNIRLSDRPRSSGAFANMLRDFDSVREFFTSATITGLVDLPFALFFLFVIFTLGGALAVVPVILIAFVLCAGTFIHLHLKGHVRESVAAAENKHSLLVESITGLETIKIAGADFRFRARYAAHLSYNALHGQSARFWSGLGVNLATFVQQAATVFMILGGMYLVQDGVLTIGGLIASVILAGRALAPVGQIANLMSRYHQAGSALRSLDRLMQAQTERPAGRIFLHRAEWSGSVAFENVNFAYPGLYRPVLQNINFRITAGERVGIIGRMGSGKSTLARLILGLYQPDEGMVLLDDTDIRQIDPSDLRRAVASIAQDVVLFSGTVRDNICIGSPRASEAEIIRAAQAAGVHEFVSRHPLGYDLPVGERGEGLSGGQRQSVALARALLSEPRVFVCDEPTNALDLQAEEAFKRTLLKETVNRTFILITHRQTMLDLVDRLILLDHGKVIMDGPRDEVLGALQLGKIEVRR
jgi:ATP-binding cassette subfamily C protein LapB